MLERRASLATTWAGMSRHQMIESMGGMGQAAPLVGATVVGVTAAAEAEEPRGESDEGEDPAGGPVAPAVQQACPANFGNSDIYGWSSLAAP